MCRRTETQLSPDGLKASINQGEGGEGGGPGQQEHQLGGSGVVPAVYMVTGSVCIIMERVQATDSLATTSGSASPREPLQLQRVGKGWAQHYTLSSALPQFHL